jgi:hypothetical protein
MANRKTIEALILRIEGLAESLSSRADRGDYQEARRRVLKE